jgi:hypothetical protein
MLCCIIAFTVPILQAIDLYNIGLVLSILESRSRWSRIFLSDLFHEALDGAALAMWLILLPFVTSLQVKIGIFLLLGFEQYTANLRFASA